jgi:hypothetical protein
MPCAAALAPKMSTSTARPHRRFNAVWWSRLTAVASAWLGRGFETRVAGGDTVAKGGGEDCPAGATADVGVGVGVGVGALGGGAAAWEPVGGELGGGSGPGGGFPGAVDTGGDVVPVRQPAASEVANWGPDANSVTEPEPSRAIRYRTLR